VEGNYSEFLVKKEEFLHAQAKHRMPWRTECAGNRVAAARSQGAHTKSKARIDNAGHLMSELDDLSARTPSAPCGSISLAPTAVPSG